MGRTYPGGAIVATVALIHVFACRGDRDKPRPAPESKPVAAVPVAGPFDTLIGPTPASPGSLLSTIEIGKPLTVLPNRPGLRISLSGDESGTVFDDRSRTATLIQLEINLDISLLRVASITVFIYTPRGTIPDDTCEGLVPALQAAWGPSANNVWEDRKTRLRAAIIPTCKLRFDRFVDPEDWINATETSVVPIDLVGKPISLLRDRLGISYDIGDEGITWRGPGIAGGEYSTQIEGYVKNGTLSGIIATIDVGDGAQRMRDRVSAVMESKPHKDPDNGFDTWKGRWPVQAYGTERFTLHVGVLF